VTQRTSPCSIERHHNKPRECVRSTGDRPGLLASGTALDEGTVGDVRVDWGSCKDGLQVRAQRSHIGRASGRQSVWEAKRKSPTRHAGEQSVNTCTRVPEEWMWLQAGRAGS
jgi:hypothetical protein